MILGHEHKPKVQERDCIVWPQSQLAVELLDSLIVVMSVEEKRTGAIAAGLKRIQLPGPLGPGNGLLHTRVTDQPECKFEVRSCIVRFQFKRPLIFSLSIA